MKLEDFKKMTLSEQLQIVNGAKGNTKEFEKNTGCEFSYSQASAVLLSQGCCMVGSASWNPPMFTKEEKRQIFEFMNNQRKSSETRVLLRPISKRRHTSFRINEKTAQRFDEFCANNAVFSSAVLMDAAINYFLDAVEDATVIFQLEGKDGANEEEENKE